MTINKQQILDTVEKIFYAEISTNTKLQRICELLKTEVYYYDWVGFYILNKSTNTLELGPYIGKTTEHTHIAVGKGVCGQVAAKCQTMIVQDVTQMDNYIACSLEVQSEIVVPIMLQGEFVAEIDIDSHSPAPFTEIDKKLLEEIAEKIPGLF